MALERLGYELVTDGRQRAEAEVNRFANATNQQLSKMEQRFAQWGKTVAASVVTAFGLHKVKELAKVGLDFNISMQQSARGIAAILRQNLPEKFDSFASALTRSKQAVMEIFELSKRSSADFVDIMEGYASNAGLMFAAGIRDLKQQFELVTLIGAAAKSMGLTGYQVTQETRALLTGRFRADALVAQVLFPSELEREAYRAAMKTGQAYDMLRSKLDVFAEQQNEIIRDWDVAWSNLYAEIRRVLGEETRDAFDWLRNAFKELQSFAEGGGLTDLISSLKSLFMGTGIALGIHAANKAVRVLITSMRYFAAASYAAGGAVAALRVALAGTLASIAASPLAWVAGIAGLAATAWELYEALSAIDDLNESKASAAKTADSLRETLESRITDLRTVGDLTAEQAERFRKQIALTWEKEKFIPGGKVVAGRNDSGSWAHTSTKAWTEPDIEARLEIIKKINRDIRELPSYKAQEAEADIQQSNEELLRITQQNIELRKAQLDLENALVDDALKQGTISLDEWYQRRVEIIKEQGNLAVNEAAAAASELEDEEAKRDAILQATALASIDERKRILDLERSLDEKRLAEKRRLIQAEIQAEKDRLSAIENASQHQLALLEADWTRTDADKQKERIEILRKLAEAHDAHADAILRERDAAVEAGDDPSLINELNRDLRSAQTSAGNSRDEYDIFRSQADDKSINDQMTLSIMGLQKQIGTFAQQAGRALTTFMGGAIDGIAGSIEGLINRTMSWGDALRNVASTMSGAVVNAISRMFAEWIVGRLAMMAKNIFAAQTEGAAETAAKTPGALLTSISSYGVAAAVGLAAVLAALAAVGGFAQGGPVNGPGGPNSDSIVARLSNGEFVLNSAARSHYGDDTLNAMNRRELGTSQVAGGGESGGGKILVAILDDRRSIREMVEKDPQIKRVIVKHVRDSRMEVGVG